MAVQERIQALRNWSPLAVLASLDDDVTDRRLLGRRYVVVRRPDLVEQVLVAGHDKYVKAVHYRLLAAVTGNGLLTSEGDDWQHQRRLIQPLVGRRQLHQLGEQMVAATEANLRRWNDYDNGEVLDVAKAMTHLTLDVVGRALFGTTLADVADRLRPAVDVGLRTAIVAARLQMLLALPRRFLDAAGGFVARAPVLPPPINRIQTAMRTIDDVVNEIVAARQQAAGTDVDPTDMVGLLLAARDVDGHPLSAHQVRDELVTSMLAGHETTANGLAWTWYLLAQHPEAEAKLHAEIDETLGDGPITPDAAERLAWAAACFSEAMRLYPPAWILEREAVTDDDLDGHRVTAGTTVIIPVHAIHHDGRYWPDPERFDPTRFLGDAGHRRHRGAYLPFGAGRRVCIGAGFAQLEAAIILAAIARRYRLTLAAGAQATPEATVTLRPRGGLPMRVARR
ncbi:MAG: cytochrome P450 [Acidimicrobiales bacterium]